MQMRSLKAGDQVQAGYRGHFCPNTFLGFTDAESKHGSTPRFQTLSEVLAHYGATSTRDLDAKLADREYGYGVYAIFRDEKDGYTWAAYRFCYAWSVGSSADRLQLRPA